VKKIMQVKKKNLLNFFSARVQWWTNICFSPHTPHPPSSIPPPSFLHPSHAAQKLQLALRIIAEFKEVFEEYRARAVAEVGPQAWSPAPKSLFLRLVCSPFCACVCVLGLIFCG
jgi:hypothetical protein